MTLDLDELERLEREATPGPWETTADPLSGVPAFVKTPGELIAADAPADAALIVAARNALPALLVELRALREVAKVAEAHLNERRGYQDSRPLWAAIDAWRGLR